MCGGGFLGVGFGFVWGWVVWCLGVGVLWFVWFCVGGGLLVLVVVLFVGGVGGGGGVGVLWVVVWCLLIGPVR